MGKSLQMNVHINFVLLKHVTSVSFLFSCQLMKIIFVIHSITRKTALTFKNNLNCYCEIPSDCQVSGSLF